jgi:hypothetical protein
MRIFPSVMPTVPTLPYPAQDICKLRADLVNHYQHNQLISANVELIGY